MDNTVEQEQKAKRGRPKTVIDYKEVERLASRLCDQKLICQILQIAVSTAQHDEQFQQSYNEGLGAAKKVLLAKQFELAEKGNQRMLEWLGKNILKQSDKLDVTQDSHVTIVISGDDKEV
jgi:hypothetical protein